MQLCMTELGTDREHLQNIFEQPQELTEQRKYKISSLSFSNKIYPLFSNHIYTLNDCNTNTDQNDTERKAQRKGRKIHLNKM